MSVKKVWAWPRQSAAFSVLWKVAQCGVVANTDRGVASSRRNDVREAKPLQQAKYAVHLGRLLSHDESRIVPESLVYVLLLVCLASRNGIVLLLAIQVDGQYARQ